MNRNEIKIDGTKILLSLFEKYKNQPWVLSSSEIENKKILGFQANGVNYLIIESQYLDYNLVWYY